MQREIACFWRPLRICGGTQHRRQIPFQLDLKFALVRRQDDGVDEASKRLGGFRAGFWMLQGLRESRHLLAIQFGHLRMQEWWRRVRGGELRLQLLTPGSVGDHLVLHFGRRHAAHHHLDQFLPPGFDALDLTFGGRQAGPVLHPEPVHLARELIAEFLKQILPKQLLLESLEHTRFDLVAPNGQAVVAAP